ncbi:hypothetical protein HK099_003116 [Clydaea vesicula]|uniref:Cytochrome P450 n=1 Tax=Clydaea vesicula TaxID=447962 RepID=A0AAD5U5A6_9FUNG|nr:hypothetical protein HK099_003116 [Clydaea vesicula]
MISLHSQLNTLLATYQPKFIFFSVFLAVITLIISKFFIKRSLFHSSLNYPVATTKLPILGPAIQFGVDGLNFLKNQKEILGSNVFLVDLLILRFHFVLGAKNTQAFYKASNDDLDFLAGVPILLPELVEDAWDVDPTFQARGHALALKGFNQKEKLDFALELLIMEVDKAIDRWDKMDKVNMFEECTRLTILVTLRFILGDKVYNEKGEELANMYDQLEKDLAHPLVMTCRPLPTGPYRRLIHVRNTLLQVIRECVETNIKSQKDDGSFLSLLVKELGPEYWYQYGYLCLGIILATRTNTAGVLAWTLSHLCDDKKLMDKVLQELKSTDSFQEGMGEIGSGGKSYPIKEYTFLDACMKETVRSYSNFMQFRKVTKKGGFEIEPGKVIPEGELICISPAEEHHDEKIFENPFEYKPERWLDQEYWAKRSREMAYVQWGFLRHRCYGEKFAQQFDKVAWARILTKCVLTVENSDQKIPECLWGSGFGTSFPKDDKPYFIKIKKRREGFNQL